MKCFKKMAEELINYNLIIRDNKKSIINSGGARRGEKGICWEHLLFDTVSNVVEEKKLKYEINKKPIHIPIPKTERTKKRNPDCIVWRDNDPLYIFSAKDYGDATQACSEVLTFDLANRCLSTFRKGLYFRGQKGSPDDAILDMFKLYSIDDKVKIYNFLDVKRKSEHETPVLDFSKNDIVTKISDFHNFMMDIIE